MMHPLKDLPISELAELYVAGMSMRCLAAKYSTSDTTIKSHLVSAGIKIRGLREACGLPSNRDVIRKLATGRSVWNKGLTADSDFRVALYSDKIKGRNMSDEWKDKLSAARMKKTWFRNCQKCGRRKGYSPRKRCCWCAAKDRAKKYPNSMLGKKLSDSHKQALLAARNVRKQTKPEKKIHDILSHIFAPYNVWKYTGLGGKWIWISNDRVRNPDFVCEHEKKIIEVFGRYWHRPEDEAVAISDGMTICAEQETG
jgi:hypothetical protein